ncbi:hypothetical protein ACP3S7_04425 [Phytobacter ursingii]|nr:hypothetical protein C2U55_14815 [Enterobacteriaceae bacterium ENNIH3]AUV09656.1 hypothetical protein C2U52_27080 [Enterobacteriaceae bacterium ENNIH2]
MNSYLFFPQNGKPSKNIAMYGVSNHRRPNLMGPNAGTMSEFPIREYVRTNANGEKETYLIAYEVEPDVDTIENAIASNRLSPVIKDDEEDDE